METSVVSTEVPGRDGSTATVVGVKTVSLRKNNTESIVSGTPLLQTCSRIWRLSEVLSNVFIEMAGNESAETARRVFVGIALAGWNQPRDVTAKRIAVAILRKVCKVCVVVIWR